MLRDALMYFAIGLGAALAALVAFVLFNVLRIHQWIRFVRRSRQ